MDWLWWLGGALGLGLLEVLVADPTILIFIVGALAGAAVAALGGAVWLQIVVACATSVILLCTIWPWMRRKMREKVPLQATNVDAHVGKQAVVVADVSASGGRVKLAGEVWTARLDAPSEPLPVGTEVTVTKIDGATAVVTPPN